LIEQTSKVGKVWKLDRNRRLRIEILQFLVGVLVTMGGAFFAGFSINSLGNALGIIHLTIGVAGVAAAVLFLQENPSSRSFLLAINVLTIAYSSFSESIAQIQSLLPPFASFASLIGTVIAIIMCVAIIYFVRKD